MRPPGSTKLHSHPVFTSLLSALLLALGALVWGLGGCGVSKLVCPPVFPSQSTRRKHSLQHHAECPVYPFPVSLAPSLVSWAG